VSTLLRTTRQAGKTCHSADIVDIVNELQKRARAIADDVLFARALETDRAALVPADLLDLLAHEGFYGMAAPREVGGQGLDHAAANPIVETLVGGCLTTTFVWLQHHNVVRAVARSRTGGLREKWLGALATGERRAGIALAGERPGPPLLSAEPSDDGGFRLSGDAPWVTGWGLIDVVLVAARRGDDVVRVLVDATARRELQATPLRMVAANASGTVALRFADLVVPPARVVEAESHADVVAHDATRLRTNGSLPLGVAGRCLRLLGASDLDAELEDIRAGLDAAAAEDMPKARARASEFAWRAAAALVAHDGARSILADAHAQRLAREAMFLLVFGSRPAIGEALQTSLRR
jgi:alkylation response protein AidB-like acyl-CoA dehydrogenase